jgi:hypothetical protein
VFAGWRVALSSRRLEYLMEVPPRHHGGETAPDSNATWAFDNTYVAPSPSGRRFAVIVGGRLRGIWALPALPE